MPVEPEQTRSFPVDPRSGENDPPPESIREPVREVESDPTQGLLPPQTIPPTEFAPETRAPLMTRALTETIADPLAKFPPNPHAEPASEPLATTRADPRAETLRDPATSTAFEAGNDDFLETRPLLPSEQPRTDPKSGAFWETIEASGEFAPGQTIFNRYVVQKKLGRGGMGAVWLVKHRELNSDRALKLIVAGIAYDQQARGRFRREAQVMAQFSHPHAVIVHDARLTENDVAYIEMEYVHGRGLDKEIHRGTPMPLDWIARVLDQLCEVLQVAHDKGIVHRDLKPANLMLLDDRPAGREHLKVLDFGIAKILGDGEPETEADGSVRTMTGMFMGTPPYASPEQSDGKADTRSDIYAVGVMLYEFLTGFRPFSGSPRQVIVETIMNTPPPFAIINPSVSYPPAIEELVMRCLAKLPEDRPQTAREVAEAFRAALPRDQPAVVIAAPPPTVPWYRSPATTVAGVVVAALLAIWGVNLSRPKPEKNPSIPKPLTPVLPVGFEAAPNAERDAGGFPKVLVPTGPGATLGMTFVLIPGGKFSMGEPGSAHPEAVADFLMSDAEVTNGAMHAYFKSKSLTPPQEFEKPFQKLISGSEKFKGISPAEAEEHPAVGIDRATARKFAAWINASLPTEAQWEYAARSKGQAKRKYVWSDQTPLQNGMNRANIDTTESLNLPTAKVRRFPDDCTEQGIYDLAGNVREWCDDQGEKGGEDVIRGASYQSMSDQYSNYKREAVPEGTALDDVGFRLVVNLSRPSDAKPTPSRKD